MTVYGGLPTVRMSNCYTFHDQLFDYAGVAPAVTNTVVGSKDYHGRTKKEAVYAGIITTLKVIESNAIGETVAKEINIRSAYRKETKKMKDSRKSGAESGEVYEPRLRYFSLLKFLEDQDTPRRSRSNMDSDDDDDEDNTGSEVNTCFSMLTLDRVRRIEMCFGVNTLDKFESTYLFKHSIQGTYGSCAVLNGIT
ncbi:hypothetical protein PR048_016290 [Dryococelus australis]|uniref:MADF domain-containing protein n=1 Tax=Dryococelus australis TaxID=614101 RepID=A0ABQ9HJB6_9NEOP|nr:hypothetical protein PR048_016290 [Dryococelus australis]